MKLAEQILKDKGYEPSHVDTAKLLKTVKAFYETHDCNSVLKIGECYLGDFHGDIRKIGFVADVDGSHKEDVKEVLEMWCDLKWDYPREEVIKLLVEEYGEDKLAYCMLYEDAFLCKQKAHIMVDKQYLINAIGVLKIHGFVTKKRKIQGKDYYEISLL